MYKQENSKEKILFEINEQKKKIEETIIKLEQEVNELKKNNLRKELLLQELINITEQSNKENL